MTTTTGNIQIDPANPIGSLKTCVLALQIPVVSIVLNESSAKGPHAEGGFGEIWLGRRTTDDPSQTLAFKYRKWREAEETPVKHCERVLREVRLWNSLRHENILPLLGVNFRPTPPPMCFISPYMPNGNSRTFFRAHPEIDALLFLDGIGAGVAYLHSMRIVHGDLRGDNILVDHRIRPLLIDFGLAWDTANVPALTTSSMANGNYLWLAPERFDPKRFGLTSTTETIIPALDLYALGMVIYELFTGHFPFYEHSTKGSMLFPSQIMDGLRPSIPTDCRPGLTGKLWTFVEACWSSDRNKRPPVVSLRAVVNTALAETATERQQYTALARQGYAQGISPENLRTLEELLLIRRQKVAERLQGGDLD